MSEVIATPPFGMDATNAALHNAMDQNGASPISPILSVRDVAKTYGSRDAVTHALNGVSFNVERGEFIAIMGPSGSGKTTLLNCISTIDRVTSGHILIDNNDITALSRKRLAKFRRDRLGFIFQDSNLLNTLNGFENISLALTIKKTAPSKISDRVNSIAKQFGVEDCLKKYPIQMSGGQMQRVAAARAIVSDPSLILADEPTGALDSRNAQIMLDTLSMMSSDLYATILMVTHDAFAASFSDRVLFIKDGHLFNELYKGQTSREEFFTRILEVISFLGGDVRYAV